MAVLTSFHATMAVLTSFLAADPVIDPAGAVTCTPIGPTTTNAAGSVAWTCVTGSTPGNVNISVDAGATGDCKIVCSSYADVWMGKRRCADE
jgi:hypothetical protein